MSKGGLSRQLPSKIHRLFNITAHIQKVMYLNLLSYCFSYFSPMHFVKNCPRHKQNLNAYASQKLSIENQNATNPPSKHPNHFQGWQIQSKRRKKKLESKQSEALMITWSKILVPRKGGQDNAPSQVNSRQVSAMSKFKKSQIKVTRVACPTRSP